MADKKDTKVDASAEKSKALQTAISGIEKQ